MAKFIKKRSKKAGLPPGTLIHIGEKSGCEKPSELPLPHLLPLSTFDLK